jgi:hypothetical protein
VCREGLKGGIAFRKMKQLTFQILGVLSLKGRALERNGFVAVVKKSGMKKRNEEVAKV